MHHRPFTWRSSYPSQDLEHHMWVLCISCWYKKPIVFYIDRIKCKRSSHSHFIISLTGLCTYRYFRNIVYFSSIQYHNYASSEITFNLTNSDFKWGISKQAPCSINIVWDQVEDNRPRRWLSNLNGCNITSRQLPPHRCHHYKIVLTNGGESILLCLRINQSWFDFQLTRHPWWSRCIIT